MHIDFSLKLSVELSFSLIIMIEQMKSFQFKLLAQN